MKTLKYFLILVSLLPLQAKAYQATQKFVINAGLFDQTQAAIAYRIEPKNFQINSSIATQGFWQKLYDFNAEYKTDGRFEGTKIITDTYQYQSNGTSGHRYKKLNMNKQGVPISRISIRKGKTKEVQIEQPDFNFDAPDMQSIFIHLIRQFKQNSFCDMKKVIYDGKKHYQIRFQDLGKTTLDDAAIPLNNDVWQCAMQITPLNEEDEDFLWKTTARTPLHLWLSKDLKTNIPFIVKIQIDSTPIGSIKAYNIENILSEK